MIIFLKYWWNDFFAWFLLLKNKFHFLNFRYVPWEIWQDLWFEFIPDLHGTSLFISFRDSVLNFYFGHMRLNVFTGNGIITNISVFLITFRELDVNVMSNGVAMLSTKVLLRLIFLLIHNELYFHKIKKNSIINVLQIPNPKVSFSILCIFLKWKNWFASILTVILE